MKHDHTVYYIIVKITEEKSIIVYEEKLVGKYSLDIKKSRAKKTGKLNVVNKFHKVVCGRTAVKMN